VYRTYDRIQQRNHTLNAVEVYHIVWRKEKRVHKMKKKQKYDEYTLQNLEQFRSINESGIFYL
jgi:hypothetical protein